jgi:hypothetical protein
MYPSYVLLIMRSCIVAFCKRQNSFDIQGTPVKWRIQSEPGRGGVMGSTVCTACLLKISQAEVPALS